MTTKLIFTCVTNDIYLFNLLSSIDFRISSQAYDKSIIIFFLILIIITTQLTYASYKSHNVSTNCTTASLECPTQEPAPLPVAPCRYRTTTTAGIRNLVTRKRRPERSADLTEWLTVGGKIWIYEEFVLLLKMTLRTQFISYTEC